MLSAESGRAHTSTCPSPQHCFRVSDPRHIQMRAVDLRKHCCRATHTAVYCMRHTGRERESAVHPLHHVWIMCKPCRIMDSFKSLEVGKPADIGVSGNAFLELLRSRNCALCGTCHRIDIDTSVSSSCVMTRDRKPLWNLPEGSRASSTAEKA